VFGIVGVVVGNVPLSLLTLGKIREQNGSFREFNGCCFMVVAVIIWSVIRNGEVNN
jgi:hypothetical protein